ncbi:MAG: tRNA (guanosine(46)-N7)-methyltransferase TrmB [Candidatus Fervidibacter sp.]|uniref:tRNA (guanosine(46)-N7)-methyltransferase TrmB n=1 Tax=Candidatus Fervidibacter sp. TaxID=3100871 RepID=UPI00404AE674
MDEILTLDGIVLRPQALPVRPNWSEIFGRHAPLLLEIGIGNGEFIVWLAQKHPEANCFGVEIDRDYLLKARNRVRAVGLTNVRLLPIEGSKVLSRLFAPGTLTALYLNFPDPWHKKRHSERRLVNTAFAWLLSSRLSVGGWFLSVTDYEPYAHEMVDAFKSCQAYEPLWETPLRTELPGYYQTKYARKLSALGRRFFYIGFRKVRDVDLPEWVLKTYPLANLRGDEQMPEVVLKVTQRVNWQDLWRTMPKGLLWQQGEDVVNVKGCYLGDDEVVIDIVVTEGRLMQRFFVTVHSHRDGMMVKIHDGSRPDFTPGVHRAIALLALSVKKLLAGAEVHHHTCGAKAWREAENFVSELKEGMAWNCGS